MRRIAFFAVLLCGALLSERALANVFVVPDRALRNRVRHHRFDWNTIDILTTKMVKPDGETYEHAGLRLYFYDTERGVAEHAAALLRQGYNYLADAFSYRPAERFSYVLYNSYTEFLETNLYYLPEGVLGVTSPLDLTLTLPYFGDPNLFLDVSTHELAHEFMIQKLRSLAREHQQTPEELMGVLPLWFVEGLAEYYAQHGMDPEAEMVARDLIVNPDVEKAHIYLGFFDERIQSVLWIYKMGQARCAFLEEEYGAGTIQRILEETPKLTGETYLNSKDLTFRDLVEMVTGDNEQKVSAKFEQWIRKNAFASYLESEQRDPVMSPLREWQGYMRTMTASKDGTMLLLRTIDMDTGQTELTLFDPRVPQQVVTVAGDGVPGTVSLHPVASRNFALSDTHVAYVALDGKNDVIYVQEIKHTAQRRDKSGEAARMWDPDPERGPDDWAVTLELGTLRKLLLDEYGITQAVGLAFSPDMSQLAFIGTTRNGRRDIYAMSVDDGTIAQLTDDRYAERELTWGKKGIIYTSDQTSDGSYNLFRIDPFAATELPVTKNVRLTQETRDHESPLVLDDGRIFYTAYTEGRSDLYELKDDGHIERRTHLTTGIFDISPGLDGGMWVAWYKSGDKRPALLAREELLATEPMTTSDEGNARQLPALTLDKAKPYDPTSASNWDLGTIFGYLGAGGGAIYGRVLATATDELKDHALVFDVEVQGRPELIDGVLLYMNQGRKTTLGAGVFQELQYRLVQDIPEIGLFASGVRFFGGVGLARYPLNTFQYAETELKLGGAGHFLFNNTEKYLRDGSLNGTGENYLDNWERTHDRSINFQSEVALRLGHDTVRYHPLTGPYTGTSLLLSGTVTAQPFDTLSFSNLRFDAARYFAILGGANFFLRGGVGTTIGGGRQARVFYLSSFDTIRGVQFGDLEYLIGRDFFYSTAELEFPLNSVIRVLFLPAIEGVLALDFGGVADNWDDVWNKRVLNSVVGVNFIFGGLMLRLHFAKPIDTGANPVAAGAPPLSNDWVTNLSLGLLYF